MVDLSELSTELIKRGWKLLQDVEPTPPQIVGDVEYVSFLRDGEIFISDGELRERAVVLEANYGQRDAEWLVANQERIPECPEGVRYILFPGTVWEHQMALVSRRICTGLARKRRNGTSTFSGLTSASLGTFGLCVPRRWLRVRSSGFKEMPTKSRSSGIIHRTNETFIFWEPLILQNPHCLWSESILQKFAAAIN